MGNLVLDEDEQRQYEEYKKKINLQAAAGEVSKIEYDMVKPVIDKATLRAACQEANSLRLGAICVLPCHVEKCVNFLGADPQTSLIACISYPYGGDTTKMKIAAVKEAVKWGVDEVEVTAPLSYVKDGNWGYVKREFKKLKKAAKNRNVRINIEYELLEPNEVSKLSSVAADCGITSIKTSSGFYGMGTGTEVIARMKAAVKDKCTIKAEGVTSVAEFEAAISMGAGIVGSKNAPDLARFLLKAAE